MNSTGNNSSTTLVPHTVGGPFPPKEGQTLKALLIGVRGTANASLDFPELKAAHQDVERIKMLLIERYYYQSGDITILTDDEVPGHVQPTGIHILKAINDLVKDAKSGDRFTFLYETRGLPPPLSHASLILDSGHSAQIKSCLKDGGLDECLVPCDSNGSDNLITDTELSTALIIPLPSGSQLVAILDACHSGSLLDLKHGKSNRDLSTSISFRGNPRIPPRGNTRFLSILSNRKKLPPNPVTGLLARRSEFSMNLTCDPPPPSSRASGQDPKSMDRPGSTGSGPRPTFTYRAPTAISTSNTKEFTLPAVGEGDEVDSTLPGDFCVFPELQRCTSPDEMFSGRGFYQDLDAAVADSEMEDIPGGVKADVISLSSCREDQTAYEDEQGNTMTSALVDGLMSKPDQSLKEVLLFLSRTIEAQEVARYARVQAYKKDCQDRQARMEARNKKFHGLRAMSFITQDSFVIPSAVKRVWTLPARATELALKKKLALGEAGTVGYAPCAGSGVL
ncbi:caspase domain-containing protein [Roridomyces roridus]|uniref:Caspase domain-containing protein n=1 Tax=Roridomyces roridus TaxID=1738132 RepID=A0AAD7B7Q1_9AGAR|nr:caspase domain-containing protein [Roridomyces roridus]